MCVEDIPSSRVIVDVKLGAKRGFCNPAESIFVSVLGVSKAYLQKIIAIHISVIFFPLTSWHIFRENIFFLIYCYLFIKFTDLKKNLFVPPGPRS